MTHLIRNAAIRRTFQDEAKTDHIMFLVSPREKKEIRRAARSVGQNMSGYLRRLHRLAMGKDENASS